MPLTGGGVNTKTDVDKLIGKFTALKRKVDQLVIKGRQNEALVNSSFIWGTTSTAVQRSCLLDISRCPEDKAHWMCVLCSHFGVNVVQESLDFAGRNAQRYDRYDICC